MHAREQPVHVHGGVPVVAAVKRGMELARVQFFPGPRKQVGHVTRVLAPYVRQRDSGERAGLLFSHL